MHVFLQDCFRVKEILAGTLVHQDWHLMNVIGYANGPTKCIRAKNKRPRRKTPSFHVPLAALVEFIASMRIPKIVGNILCASMERLGSMVVL